MFLKGIKTLLFSSKISQICLLAVKIKLISFLFKDNFYSCVRLVIVYINYAQYTFFLKKIILYCSKYYICPPFSSIDFLCNIYSYSLLIWASYHLFMLEFNFVLHIPKIIFLPLTLQPYHRKF